MDGRSITRRLLFLALPFALTLTVAIPGTALAEGVDDYCGHGNDVRWYPWGITTAIFQQQRGEAAAHEHQYSYTADGWGPGKSKWTMWKSCPESPLA